jgi:hypothetical protein
MLTIVLAALLATSAPPACECLCEIVLPPGGTGSIAAAHERDVIFQGTALEVEYEAGRVLSVRFLVHRVWRGQVADTATLEVGIRAPCAHYSPGEQYLVTADRRETQGGPIVGSQCHDSVPVGSPRFHELTGLLGGARTTYGDPLHGSLRGIVTTIGSVPAAAPDTVRLGLSIPNAEDIAEVVIADQRTRPRSGVASFTIPGGVYEVALVWGDGRRASALIAVRCGEWHPLYDSTRPCNAHRSLRNVRPE